ncbi:hypothetical protein [Dyadobacter sp. 50-39]|uniref:hypothetical protein n=1 Tax=Dyadobacter sp. 50-39 TaxID=1895756 RepID=UPI000A7279F3|nr:hypothetical protein [Dyadobacter sp. 50-39]
MSSTIAKYSAKSASSRAKRGKSQSTERHGDQIVVKTQRMVEVLEKYPKPTP